MIKSCCGCLSLRTGCIIIATLEFVILIPAFIPEPLSTELVIIGLRIAALAFVGLLVYGIVRENRMCLRLWVIINGIGIALLGAIVCLYAFAFLVMSLTPPKPGSDNQNLGKGMFWMIFSSFALFVVAVVTVQGLSAFVVYSYYVELRDRDEVEKNKSAEAATAPEMHGLVPV